MSRNLVSFLFAFILSAGIASCGTELAFAQDEGTTPPPALTGGANFQMMPPPPGGNFDGQRMTPPQPPQGGNFRSPQMLGEPPREIGTQPYSGNYGQRFPQGEPTRQPNQPFFQPNETDTNGGPKMPGEQKNMKGSQGQGISGMRGGEGENYNDGDGMSEAKANEQQKKMQAQQLAQMKRGMMSSMEQGLKRTKKSIDRLTKKGIAIPTETQTLISEIEVALQVVKSATEMTDEVLSALEILQDKGQDLGDMGRRLGMLEQMSQMTKQVEKEFAKIDKEVTKAKKSKEANQYPDVIAKIESQLSSLKVAWSEAKTSLTSADAEPDAVRDAMEEIFSGIQEVRKSLGTLKQLSSVTKMLASAKKQMTTYEKQIARLKKAGKDVSSLESLFSQAKSKLDEITTISKQASFDPEDLFDGMQELDHIGNEAMQEMDKVNGTSDGSKLGASVIESLQLRHYGF